MKRSIAHFQTHLNKDWWKNDRWKRTMLTHCSGDGARLPQWGPPKRCRSPSFVRSTCWGIDLKPWRLACDGPETWVILGQNGSKSTGIRATNRVLWWFERPTNRPFSSDFVGTQFWPQCFDRPRVTNRGLKRFHHPWGWNDECQITAIVSVYHKHGGSTATIWKNSSPDKQIIDYVLNQQTLMKDVISSILFWDSQHESRTLSFFQSNF